jgi:hypothetical protein
MAPGSNTFRSLVIYALALPLALILGLMLASPLELSTISLVLLVLVVVGSPLLLKWHHPLLFLTWNMTAVVFFLPGNLQIWLVTAVMSLGLSMVHRALVMSTRFIHAASIVLPLLFLGAIVFMTGRLTGGFGMKLFGSEMVGGKRYLLVFAGLIGFFAMTAQRVPAYRAPLYTGMFFLGALVNAASTLIPYFYHLWPGGVYFLSRTFPVGQADASTFYSDAAKESVSRFYGLTLACASLVCYLLARYGIREILTGRKLWRFLLVAGVLALGALGGFRSYFILLAMTFMIVFYLEGLVRSRYAALLLVVALIASAFVIPYANKLPLSIQRTLSFLPLNVEPVARFDAEASSEWRLRIWKTVWPEVPQYLWLGKGLSVDNRDLELADELEQRGRGASGQATILAGDFHNGPLTILIPFGIWGVIGWVWFLGACLRALYLNHRYGEERLRKINTFLLAFFLAKTIQYFFVFGNFYTDFADFCGLIGLSLALNGGIRKAYRVPRLVKPVTLRIPAPLKPSAIVSPRRPVSVP